MSKQFTFEDKHAAHAVHGYLVTNEEPQAFNVLLNKHCPKFGVRRAGGIASGGEISFISMLPRVKELILVDHSYRAIAACYVKALLMEELGIAKFKEVVATEEWDAFDKRVQKLWDHIPEPLRTKVSFCSSVGGYGGHAANGANYVNPIQSGDYHTMRREFFYADNDRLRRSLAKFGNVKMVHGDITDLKDSGPFDLFYLSNADGHTGRSKVAPKLDEFKDFLAPGGFLLHSGLPDLITNKGWELVDKVLGMRTSWQHNLLRLKPATKTVQ